jgi:hypothetical protein
LEEAGVPVQRHDDHFHQATLDEVWIPEVARRGWIALSRNERIRYTPTQRDALMRSGLRCFFLVGKNQTRQHVLGEVFVSCFPSVLRFLDAHPEPFMAKIYCNPSSKNPGRISLWLSHEDWLRR